MIIVYGQKKVLYQYWDVVSQRKQKKIWASSWENVSSEVSDQVRLKLACSATEASRRLEILAPETRDITLSRQRTTKALIRLRGCAGWSAPLLFAYDIRHVFSWPGSFIIEPAHEIMVTWAKAQASLCIRAVLPEPSLFAHMKYGSRWRVWLKIRHLAPLDGCPCTFEEWVYGGRKVP